MASSQFAPNKILTLLWAIFGSAIPLVASAQHTPPAASALPTGAKVVSGVLSVGQSGTTANPLMTVQQLTDRGILNWDRFDIGSAATVRFVQPTASASTLNRVLDSNPSQIFGKLESNGQVILTNPNGVLFGRGSSVDVGALVATTLTISDADFMAGRMLFSRNGSTGHVSNQGRLAAKVGGYIALLAPEVQNAGVIIARAGAVVLAAGETVTLNFDPSQSLTHILTTPSKIASLVENKQLVQAEDGQIILSAQGFNQITAEAIGQVRNSGQLTAQGITKQGGRILLEGGSVTQAGSVDVSSVAVLGTGGQVTITGERLDLRNGSSINATGPGGGGTVLVGGDWQGSGNLYQASQVTMAPEAQIDASATVNGSGGRVVLWSRLDAVAGRTSALGSIAANAGPKAGDGGQIETSGHTVEISQAKISASAQNGRSGLWLLDPYDYTINSTAASTIATSLNAGTSVSITTATNTGAGAGASGSGDITVSSAIAKTAGAAATLTLTANRNIALNADITSNSNTLGLTLEATTGSVSGTGNINTNGGALSITQATAGTLSGVISGSGALNKAGAGTLTLTGTNTYTGNTTITAGELTIGGAGILGTGNWYAGNIAISSGATITWNTISGQMLGGAITGEGSVRLLGTGYLWIYGENTYTGDTIVQGPMALGGGHMVNNPSATITVNNGGSLSLGGDWIFTGSVSIPVLRPIVVNYGGVLANSRWSQSFGPITLNGGTFQLNNYTTYLQGTITVNGGANMSTITGLGYVGATNNGTITFNVADGSAAVDLLVSGNLGNANGANGIVKSGSGLMRMTGTNSYTGTTTVSAGTLQLAKTAVLYGGTTSSWTANNLIVASGATLAVSYGGSGEFTSANLATLLALGGASNGLKSGAKFGIDTTSGSQTYSGVIADPNGGSNVLGISKLGTNTLTLTGANTYTGTTTVSAGTLQVGDGGSSGSLGTGAIVNNGAIAVNRSDAVVLANDVSGSGALALTGTGTTTITGNNTYSGPTTITAGTLQVGAGGTSGSLGTGAVINNGSLAVNRSDAITFANNVSGSGALALTGTGTTTITGANTYSGATTIIAGTLKVGDGGTSGSLGTGSIVNNGSLKFDKSIPMVMTNNISGSGATAIVTGGVQTSVSKVNYGYGIVPASVSSRLENAVTSIAAKQMNIKPEIAVNPMTIMPLANMSANPILVPVRNPVTNPAVSAPAENVGNIESTPIRNQAPIPADSGRNVESNSGYTSTTTDVKKQEEASY